jgi:hypothetical protein
MWKSMIRPSDNVLLLWPWKIEKYKLLLGSKVDFSHHVRFPYHVILESEYVFIAYIFLYSTALCGYSRPYVKKCRLYPGTLPSIL